MKIRCDTNEDLMYINYLTKHIENTYRAFLSIKDILVSYAGTEFNVSDIEQQIRNHDQSKLSENEWEAYRNYFYPTDENPKDEAAFDLAWLHHQHNNPHHWQHWTLLRDSGETVALDIPINYIIEMLCDWHSFSKNDPKSTAYNWYVDNKKNMILSQNTQTHIDKYIELFKEPLV